MYCLETPARRMKPRRPLTDAQRVVLLATFGRCLACHGDGEQGKRQDKDKREEGAAREGW
jgi:hypothetical protein